jgi:hypothetical protein
MTCSKAHVFPRHAHTLLRHLQDMRANGIIMTCKPCEHAIQHSATVHCHVADRSQSWHYSTVAQLIAHGHGG